MPEATDNNGFGMVPFKNSTSALLLRVVTALTLVVAVTEALGHAAQHGVPSSECSVCLVSHAGPHAIVERVGKVSPPYSTTYFPVPETLFPPSPASDFSQIDRGPPAL